MIRACPRCGSQDLDMPGFEDGIVPETDNLNEYVCGKCDLRAIPLEFDRESDYKAFVENLWITACAECGSADLRPPGTAMEGKIPGLYAVAREMVCRSCGATTHPFEFDDEAAWKAFVEARSTR